MHSVGVYRQTYKTSSSYDQFWVVERTLEGEAPLLIEACLTAPMINEKEPEQFIINSARSHTHTF